MTRKRPRLWAVHYLQEVFRIALCMLRDVPRLVWDFHRALVTDVRHFREWPLTYMGAILATCLVYALVGWGAYLLYLGNLLPLYLVLAGWVGWALLYALFTTARCQYDAP